MEECLDLGCSDSCVIKYQLPQPDTTAHRLILLHQDLKDVLGAVLDDTLSEFQGFYPQARALDYLKEFCFVNEIKSLEK